MIIEFHLTTTEAGQNDDHLGFCEDDKCEHLAHLFEDLVDGYADVADVFAFVERSRFGYEKRLQHNRVRREREKRLARCNGDQARTLAIIRRGWDRLYGTDAAQAPPRFSDTHA